MSNYYDNTSLGGSNVQFPVTEWTRLLDPARADAILAELCERYWKPVYAYLRRKGYNNEEAKDLVQAFFTDKILGKQLVKKADRTIGKFRAYLRTAVSNYAIDVQRAKKPTLQLDEQMDKSSDRPGPKDEFDRAWAQELLQQVLADLETECQRNGKIAHWQVFHAWMLESDPQAAKVSMGQICRNCGIDDPNKAYNMIANIKRRFRVILRSHLRPLVDTDAEVDAEIGGFIKIFSRSGARK